MQSSSENTAHSANSSRTLVVMAKAPRPGMVKTRLAQSLPVEAVTELYRCLLDDTMALARSLGSCGGCHHVPCFGCRRTSAVGGQMGWVSWRRREKALRQASPRCLHISQRLASGASIAFNSDSPHLPASVLESAFEALTAHDVVVGPTHDGGYYLVGAKAAHPALFEGDGMGTKSALEALLARARSLQLSVGFTDPFYDIDVAGDLIRLAAELQLAPAQGATNGGLAETVGTSGGTVADGRGRPVKLTPSRRLYGLGAILLVALTICSRNFSSMGAPSFIIPLAVAGIAYLLAIREFFSTPTFPKHVIVIGLVLAALWHLLFLLRPPGPDDDIHRYVWDGRVQRLGYNPYIVVPSDPALAAVAHTRDPHAEQPGCTEPISCGRSAFLPRRNRDS